MFMTPEFKAAFEEAMQDASGIIVPEGWEDEPYYEALRSSVRAAACAPFPVRAAITGDDFPDEQQGLQIDAYVIAKAEYRWLAYRPESNEYYCFWGDDAARLGAFRQPGRPLFVWWD